MNQLSSLSIFFPCLNDALVLPTLIKKANTIASKFTNEYEIIIVNDGSTDDSLKVLRKMKKIYSRLKIIDHGENRGYGAALRSGFKNSNKDWVFYTDGDGQYDVGELSKLIHVLDARTDVVNGYKKSRQDSIIRKIFGYLYNLTLHLKYKLPIKDIDCDFRLMKNSLLKKISLQEDTGAICLELILKLQKQNAHFKEVEVNHYPRLYGKSQFFTPKHLFKTALSFFKS